MGFFFLVSCESFFVQVSKKQNIFEKYNFYKLINMLNALNKKQRNFILKM